MLLLLLLPVLADAGPAARTEFRERTRRHGLSPLERGDFVRPMVLLKAGAGAPPAVAPDAPWGGPATPSSAPVQRESAPKQVLDPKLDAARRSIQEGRYERALKSCLAVLDLEPRNEDALQVMGSAYWLMGQRHKAAKIWRQVLEINPNNKVVEDFLQKVAAR
jgi:tetratricopeptide (TPR) repeat protein